MIDPAADCWGALGEADSGAPLLSPILFPARQGRVELVTPPSTGTALEVHNPPDGGRHMGSWPFHRLDPRWEIVPPS